MSSREDLPNHLLVVQLNADLRSAQIDLLSAQCATDRLRLRFSPQDMTRYGDRELLRKATNSAIALHDFYQAIDKVIHAAEADPANDMTPAPEG